MWWFTLTTSDKHKAGITSENEIKDKNIPFEKQAKILYHEIMGHAGVANVINNQEDYSPNISKTTTL